MLNTKITLPVSLDEFRSRTQVALERFQGSPISKPHKVTRFLTDQLGYENEHVMAADLNQQGSPDVSPNNDMATYKADIFILTLSEWDGDQGRVIRSEVYAFVSASELKDAVPGLLSPELGDHDGVVQDFIEAAELDPDDDAVKAAANAFDVDALVAMSIEYRGLDVTLDGVAGAVTYDRVNGTVSRKRVTLRIPMKDLSVG